ncbi:MAG: hypothetical protein Lokiarch_31450 [Candidatus Lokiarchaeum sp. GC14_75]|nr:MAG: hypothetical protein Lokiarch_31450 [Candidatus Lokiarchaeum sp. GC14_75]
MAKDKSTAVKKKDEKRRKISVISQIDDLLAIQGQDYMKGQLKEALALADQIIELAQSENLTSFIKEQEELIAKIKKLMERREQEKRQKVVLKLKLELKKLEIDFKRASKSEDYSETDQILKDTKKFLIELGDNETSLHWKSLEKEYLDTRARKEINEEILRLIEDSTELQEKFLFSELKLRLTYLLKQVEEKGLTGYLEKLKKIEEETISAENTYNTIKGNIQEISEKIAEQQENKEFQSAIVYCEELIQLAMSINNKEIEEENLILLKVLNEGAEFEYLKKDITELNEEGLSLLKRGEIQTSLTKFKLIYEKLSKQV